MNEQGRSPDGDGALSGVYGFDQAGITGDGWGAGYADGVWGFSGGDGGDVALDRQVKCHASFQYEQNAGNVGR